MPIMLTALYPPGMPDALCIIYAKLRLTLFMTSMVTSNVYCSNTMLNAIFSMLVMLNAYTKTSSLIMTNSHCIYYDV